MKITKRVMAWVLSLTLILGMLPATPASATDSLTGYKGLVIKYEDVPKVEGTVVSGVFKLTLYAYDCPLASATWEATFNPDNISLFSLSGKAACTSRQEDFCTPAKVVHPNPELGGTIVSITDPTNGWAQLIVSKTQSKVNNQITIGFKTDIAKGTQTFFYDHMSEGETEAMRHLPPNTTEYGYELYSLYFIAKDGFSLSDKTLDNIFTTTQSAAINAKAEDISRTIKTYNFPGDRVEIPSAAVTVKAPVAQAAPNTAATVASSEHHTASAVTWTPTDNSFNYATEYTASVTLTPEDGYQFTNTSTATVNGQPANVTLNNPAGTLTVAYQFSATDKATAVVPAVTLSKPTENGFTVNVTSGARYCITTSETAPALLNTTNYPLTGTGADVAVTGKSANTQYWVHAYTPGDATHENSAVTTKTITTAKKAVTISAPAAGTYTYTGAPQGPDKATETVGGDSVALVNTYTGTGYNSTTKPTNAGDYILTLTIAADNPTYQAQPVTVNFTITPAAITGKPTISDTTPTIGDTLTADVTGVTPQAGLTYQWKVGGNNVATGGTGNTYTVVAADFGKTITVEVTGAGNYRGTVTSDATSAVAKKTRTAVAPTGVTSTATTITYIPTIGQKYLVNTNANATTTDFNSATAANTNPVTKSGLAANTTYYIHTYLPGDGEFADSAVVSKLQKTGAKVLTVELTGDLEFSPITYGDAQPAAKTFTVKNTGSENNQTVTLTLTGTNASSFALSKANVVLDVGASDATITVRPNDKLAAGTYTAKLKAQITGGAAVEIPVSITVDKKAITGITGVTATKVYDTTNTLLQGQLTGIPVFTGMVAGDTLEIASITASYSTADAHAISAAVSVTAITLGGTSKDNYTINPAVVTGITGTITKATQATLTLTGVGPTATYGDEKMTLGTTGGSGTGAVTYAITANTDDAAELTDTGTNIQIKKPGSFTVKATKATDGNYNAATSATVTCTVSKKQLTWTSGTVSATKEYDGTTNDAALSGAPVLVGMAGSETVVATVTGGQKVTFKDNANVGTAHTYDVTSGMFTYTYGAGAAETNYILPANTLTPANGKITASPLTAVGDITGTVKVGETLTIGAVAAQNGKTPVLTTDYTIQWFRADSDSANEAPIGTAVNANYTLTPDDIGKIIYAKVMGVTNYSGVVTTLKTGAAPKPAITAIAAISGITKFGQELTAGALTPDTATVTYQWYRSDMDDNFSGASIAGATLNKYTLEAADIGKYIYVQVTGKDNYCGTVSSAQTAQIAKADPPIAPAGVGKVDVAANDDTTGKLTGVSALMEYAAESTFTSPIAITGTTVTGLPAGTYYVRIKETATTLAGAASGGLVIAPAVPNKVTGVAASGNGQLVITWAKPKMNGGTFTKYVVDIKTGGASGTSVATYPKDITANVDTLTETVTGLTNGTTYTITVQAVNSLGAGAVSDSINATPSGGGTVTQPIPKPEPPKIDPVTGNTNVEIVVKPETKGDTSTAVVPKKTMTDAISSVVKEAAKTGGTASVEIIVDALKDAKTVEAELTRTIIRAVAESEVDSLKVTSPVASITFDTQALATIAAEAAEEKVIISAAIVPEKKLDAAQKSQVGDAPVYDLTVISGSKIISDFKGGTATVTLPYELKAGDKAEFVTVWYLDDAGKLIPIRGKYEGGFVTFTVDHFSRYAIGYLPFADVKADWAYESIVYAYQNKLLSGVGGDKFAPADNMTRAMLWTVLYRAAGSPAKTDNANWYADAQAWAMAEKISDGTNPTGNVTRQELATILCRYAKSTAVQADMSGFSDMAEVAEWAADGMNWAVANGILKGIGDKLNPTGNATRAQVATMLQRYLTK